MVCEEACYTVYALATGGGTSFISVLASKFSFFCGGGAWGFKAYGTCFHGFQGRILIPSCSAVEDISLDRPVEIFEGKEGIKELQE